MSLLVLTTIVSMAVAVVATLAAWYLWREERARSAARIRALGAAIDDHVGSEEPGVPMFASADTGGRTLQRLGPALGVGALVVSTLAAAALFVGSGQNGSAEAAGPDPIDLLSMQHVSELGDFVVTGVVRNPHSAEARGGIDAVAFFFDERGGFITSAKAPLDAARLEAGGESSFRIKIPRPAGLERYRLSFRSPDGKVLPHVDRREVK